MNAELCLSFLDMVQRLIGSAGLLVEEYGVAVAECAPLNILAGQSHRMAFQYQRTVGVHFTRSPVDGEILLDHSAPYLEQLVEFLVEIEPLRN